ncbi:FAD-binding domain-containing protein [Methylophilus aquaticus]|uniref:FAD-binding domain-containing protein n=1 Tax=Methylophilus aquaticus TaxID=1971610 RepID=A0ABT9JR23_9PROT|nr:FAD-binding domain-containing protein [Methylophilus aquaticus]MDP8567035.1 FAD-binding domain-containing protein [Methylophilus aquaticus]
MPQARYSSWLLTLRSVPNSWSFKPWRMLVNLQRRYGCIIGQHYPAPLVDIATAARQARQSLGEVRAEMQNNGAMRRILQQHASRKSSHFSPRPASIRPLDATSVNTARPISVVQPVQASLPF